MLSRRTIVFIDGEIFFRCRKTCWFENIDIIDGRKTWGAPPSFGMPSSMLERRWSKETPGIIAPAVLMFAKYASEMSTRQLTVSSDFLDAFRGISNVLCREINTTVFWGTPTAHFDLFPPLGYHRASTETQGGISELVLGWMAWGNCLESLGGERSFIRARFAT